MKNINNNILTSEISSKNYLRYFLIFCAITFTGGGLVYLGNNKALFGIISLLLITLVFERPKWFVYIAITWILSRLMFTSYPLEYFSRSWAVAYLGRGDLVLSFLRYATPDNLLIRQLPKVIFIGPSLYLSYLFLSRSSFFSKSDSKLNYIGLFVLISLASAVVNLDFFLPKIVLFFYHFLFPVVIFYYVIAIGLEDKEKSRLFAYFMFICFEMQLFFTIVQNFPKLLNGQWLFADEAIGTFSLPMCQTSSALLATALFFFLADYIVSKRKINIFKMLLAFIGILSASVFFFTMLLLVSIFAYMIIAYSFNIIKRTRIILSSALVGFIIIVPIIISQNLQSYSGRDYFIYKIEENRAKKITEINKIYSFINLGTMMLDEDKYILGAGPGNFLTSAGTKYNASLAIKYGSWNVASGILGSGDFIENSFVGLVGETGIFGWLFYLLFYFNLFKTFTLLAKRNNYNSGSNPTYLFLSATFALFLLYSFFIGIFEIIENIIPLMVFAALVYSQNQNN